VSSSELLRVDGLCVDWGGRPVLRSVGFGVGANELVVLLGPNGSGKTTLLRTIVGLERPSSGQVWFDGQELRDRPTHRRGIGLLAQEPALFPRRSVAANVAYGLEVGRRPPAEVRDRVREMLALVGLAGFDDRPPTALSGGERQRVALARTLAPRPRLVLLDEPFAAIDVERRAELLGDFRRVLRATGTAAVHVTHDREEGFLLADRVLLLWEGALVQSGPPEAVLRRPVTPAVARFLGYNVLPGADGPVAVEPHAVRLGPPGTGAVDAEVLADGPTGSERRTYLLAGDGRRIEARRPAAAPSLSPGTIVGVTWTETVPIGAAVGAPV